MEERRGDRPPAGVGEPDGDVADVAGDAERLLDDDDGTPHLPVRGGFEGPHGTVVGIDGDFGGGGHDRSVSSPPRWPATQNATLWAIHAPPDPPRLSHPLEPGHPDPLGALGAARGEEGHLRRRRASWPRWSSSC